MHILEGFLEQVKMAECKCIHTFVRTVHTYYFAMHVCMYVAEKGITRNITHPAIHTYIRKDNYFAER